MVENYRRWLVTVYTCTVWFRSVYRYWLKFLHPFTLGGRTNRLPLGVYNYFSLSLLVTGEINRNRTLRRDFITIYFRAYYFSVSIYLVVSPSCFKVLTYSNHTIFLCSCLWDLASIGRVNSFDVTNKINR